MSADHAVLLGRWFEARLHESVGFTQRGCRLYGLEVLDTAGLETGDPLAARASFVSEADERETLLCQPGSRRVIDFDAAALVTVEWQPVGAGRPPRTLRPMRPGDYSPRRRARVVELVYGDLGVTVIRFEDDPEFVVLAAAS